jgi:2-keto-3-deoxy-L-rhamnonate aldolase RhmA
MKLIYLTNDVEIAGIAERAGVDWIFVDLEYHGKVDRQAGRNTVISSHTIEDVARMRGALSKAELLVRLNPMGPWSAGEIEATLAHRPDTIMLPFFTCADEVARFIDLVNGRARTCLLVETLAAIDSIDSILSIPGVDCVHVGLNDLHIARGTRFMFEFLADGSLDRLADRIKSHGVPFGFGGMGRIGEKIPPAESILAEHFRLGSTMVILSRAFLSGSVEDRVELERRFTTGVRDIRKCEQALAHAEGAFFEDNRLLVREQVYQVADGIGR